LESVIAPPAEAEAPTTRRGAVRSHGIGVALVLSGIALLAAAAAAVGPAHPHRESYRWPPPRAAAVDGPRYAPLLLTRHRPERLTATAPCADLEQLMAGQDSDTPLTLLATARSATGVDGSGLFATLQQGALEVRLGDRQLARTPWPAPGVTGPNCNLAVALQGGDWRVTSAGSVLGSGRAHAPNVSGLYTDLPSATGLSVVVETGVVGSSPSIWQWLLNGLAVAAGVAALVLLLRATSEARTARTVPARLRRFLRAIGWIDVAVVGALLVWWVVGPTFFDDGWVIATLVNRPASHSFSVYYDNLGVPYPFVFLPLAVQYAVSRISTSLLWLRVPTLLIGLATWGMLRGYLSGVLGTKRRLGLPVLTLAAMFLVGWFSWLGTLRPEPAVAILAALVILATRRFHHTERTADLTVAVLGAAVAVTVHPEGIVAFAPLVVTTPALYRWGRERGRHGWLTLATIGLVAGALLLILLFADTDLKLFRESRNVFASDAAHGETWRDELQRYVFLFSNSPFNTFARRASALFALIPISLFLTRPDRRRNLDLDLPVLSLMLSVAALAVVPSKWPWQLGTLVPFAALAAGAEVHRLLVEPVGSSRVRRLLLALGGTAVVSAIAWRGNAAWAQLLPVHVQFGSGGSDFVHVDLSSETVWVGLVIAAFVAATVVVLVRSRGKSVPLLRRVAPALTWTGGGALAVSAALAAMVTLALFVVDGFGAPSWSLAKQNVHSTGSSCGLGDVASVVDPAEGSVLPTDSAPSDASADTDLPTSAVEAPLAFTREGVPAGAVPVPGVDEYWGSRVDGGDATGGFESPWFVVDRSSLGTGAGAQRLVGFVAGKIDGGNRLFVQWGRRDGASVTSIGVAELPPTNVGSEWHAVLLDSLARISTDADRLRLVGVDATTGDDGWLAFASPRMPREQLLASLLSRSGVRTLAVPWVRPYFPCVSQPRMGQGVTEAPDVMVGDVTSDAYSTSPMRYVRDLYPVSRLILLGVARPEAGGFTVDRIEKQLAPGTSVSVDMHSG
jgi:arabinosyltransferase C